MKIDTHVLNRDYLSCDLSKSKVFKNTSMQINQPKVFLARDHIAVKFTLSEDAKEEYRSYVQNKMRYSDSETDQVSKLSLDTVLTDIESIKNNPINKITMRSSGLCGKWFDNPSDMFAEYAKLYDEIVQGYQNGTRENYIADKDAEYGWRKATLEDELTFLDKDFKNYLIGYEKQKERNAVYREAIIKIARQLEESGSGHLEFVGKAKKLESESAVPLPENFVERMCTASKEFASQYMMRFSRQGSVDVSKLLSDVVTIHLGFLKKDK